VPHPALPLLRRFGVPLLLWLLRRIGPEGAWTAVQARVEAVGDRQQAIRKARMSGGGFGAWIAEGRTRYVVFAGGEPIDIFPALEGDLAAALRHYDRSRLRRPDELRTAVARRRVHDSVERLRRRLRRGEEPGAPAIGALPPGERGVRAAQAALERVAGELAPLLDELTAAPERPGAEAPQAPGVYLLADGGTPIEAGEATDLRAALGARPAARWVEVADPFRRALFAPYASELLGTDDDGGST
jgi:hypothetical protein